MRVSAFIAYRRYPLWGQPLSICDNIMSIYIPSAELSEVDTRAVYCSR